MEQQLVNIGLGELQAKTYLFLLAHPNGSKPSQIAKHLSITRTNSYKLLDQLIELDLVRKSSDTATYTYFAEDPIALTSFVSRARNHAIELEKQIKSSMAGLQMHYQKNRTISNTTTTHGKTAIIQAYKAQYKHPEIRFIKSRADIPFMGYETMATLRSEPKKYDIARYGITPDVPEAPSNPKIDERSGLTRTWISGSDYSSPVEWMVAGDELAIVTFTNSGSVIRIKDKIIANAFVEIWSALSKNLRANPGYASLPEKAERKI